MRLTKEKALEFLRDRESTRMACFSQIDDDAARLLGQSDNGEIDLSLDSLTDLSACSAKWLGRTRGLLFLSGLKEISDQVADYLGEHQGELGLDGLVELSEAASLSLARHEGLVDLTGLNTLNDTVGHLQIARRLLECTFGPFQDATDRPYEKELNLCKLSRLSPKAAAILAENDGNLILGLRELGVDTANSLAQHRGTMLDLPNLQAMTDECFESLSKYGGWLALSGIRNISARSAFHLSHHRQVLYLGGLEEIDETSARHLSNHPQLYLENMTYDVRNCIQRYRTRWFDFFRSIWDYCGWRSSPPQ